MGYRTDIDGEITITPPLQWAEIKDSPFLPDNAQGGAARDCMYRMVEITVETDEGLLTKKIADALVSTWEDDTRAYSLEEHVQEAMNLHQEGHEFGGFLNCEGEENGDLWRLYPRGGQAVRIDAVITWPEI